MEKTEDLYSDLVGRVCITPYKESLGLVLVDMIHNSADGWIARGTFFGNHPAGYANGAHACYFAKELTPTVLCMRPYKSEKV